MKKLVVLVAGLLSVALFAQAEETQNTKENTFSMKVQIRPRAEACPRNMLEYGDRILRSIRMAVLS